MGKAAFTFVRFTRLDGTEILINLNTIVYVSSTKDSDNSEIYLNPAMLIKVKESPSKVTETIKNAFNISNYSK